jgi:hypothetical protein
MRRALLVAALCTLACSSTAVAQRCAVIEGGAPALGEVDAAERLAFLRRGLADAAHRARIWSWTFGISYGALAALQLAVSPAFSSDDRPNYWIGGSAAALGVLVVLVMPLKVMRDHRWLEARIERAPPGEDPCAPLADAERLLLRDARSERFGRAWYIHVGNLLFNIGIGLTLSLAFQHYAVGSTTAIIGATVGEIQINTQPKGSVELLDRYRAGNLGPPPAAARMLSWRLAPLTGGGVWGLGATGTF